MQTVMITGCSSGFGLDTARLFLERGWHVAATMRRPETGLLPVSDRLRVLPLDVTDTASIADAVAAASDIDALVNNAGIGWLNALESTSMETARQIFETNTIGTMAVMQAVLPQFRSRGAGVVVNVTSSVTLKPLPLLSVYTASKAAVNAFTESVAIELAAYGIRAVSVLPGRAPDTRFAANARTRIADAGGFPEAYAPLVQKVFEQISGEDPEYLTRSGDVAEAVWRAVTDPACPGRLPAGADAVAWAQAS